MNFFELKKYGQEKFTKLKKRIIDYYDVYVDLEAPTFTRKYALKIKPYVKIVYIVLTFFMGIGLLGALVSLFSGSISLALIYTLLIGVNFVVLRMWCEFLVNLPESFFETEKNKKNYKK